MQALVYRRGLRAKPRESALRIAAWVGTILIHLVFLFGMILGPAYDVLPPPPEPDNPQALLVRLIDKPPPPVPPVRGTPSKAPVKKSKAASGRAVASRASRGAHASAVASAQKALPAIAVPAAPPPAIKPDVRVVAPPPAVQPVPDRPLVEAKAPPAQPDLQQVPVPTQAPPDLALDTPRPEVVPPRFQPEPVRKPQAEGTRAMPPPASLALPPTPAAQMAVTPTPPQITSERTTPVPTTTMTLASVPRPEVEPSSAPANPQEAPLPAIAQEPAAPPAPTVAPPDRPVPPKVAVEAVKAPPVEAEAELHAVPLPDASLRPTVSAPAVAADRPVVQAPSVAPAELQRPVAGVEPDAGAPGEAPGDTAAGQADASALAAQRHDSARGAGAADAAGKDGAGASSAKGDATAQGGTGTPGAADTGTPGAAHGVEQSDRVAGAQGTSQRDDGVAGGQGDKTGQVGAYVELKPHGNVTPQNGPHVQLQYKATRFEKDWAPKGESSVDTALRQASESATRKSTLQLPRGIRINCVAGPGNAGGTMKAISLLTLGCGGDPPPKPSEPDKLAKNQTMAPSKPLADNLPPANATTVAAAPQPVDNTAFCATARVAGGPLPPGCDASIKINVQGPAAATGSWVPASDQFKPKL